MRRLREEKIYPVTDRFQCAGKGATTCSNMHQGGEYKPKPLAFGEKMLVSYELNDCVGILPKLVSGEKADLMYITCELRSEVDSLSQVQQVGDIISDHFIPGGPSIARIPYILQL